MLSKQMVENSIQTVVNKYAAKTIPHVETRSSNYKRLSKFVL